MVETQKSQTKTNLLTSSYFSFIRFTHTAFHYLLSFPWLLFFKLFCFIFLFSSSYFLLIIPLPTSAPLHIILFPPLSHTPPNSIFSSTFFHDIPLLFPLFSSFTIFDFLTFLIVFFFFLINHFLRAFFSSLLLIFFSFYNPSFFVFLYFFFV